MLSYEMTYGSIVSILSAVITGGFVLIFVEIGNRKNRENDRYQRIMEPFMRKLCAYFRYVEWTSKCIIYPQKLNENEEAFKFLVTKIGNYGSRLVIGGGDFSLNHFSPQQLHDICYGINNIWYYYDRMRPCNMKWDEDFSFNEEYINKELIKLDKSYIGNKVGMRQLIKISGDFFTDVYQPIEYEPENHHALSNLYRFQSAYICMSLFLVLIILCLMITFELPMLLLKVITILIVLLFGRCLLFLFISEKRQLQWYYGLRQRIKYIFTKTGKK